MKLSREAIEDILHVISTFDRERGIPHDYHDLQVVLAKTNFEVTPAGEIVIAGETVKPTGARVDGPLDDSHEAKAMFLEAARAWMDE